MGGNYIIKKKIIIFFILVLLIVIIFNIGSCSEIYKEYSIENWNKSSISNRYEMAIDIVKNNLLSGMSYNDVLAQLGEKGINSISEKSIEYIIGYNVIDRIYLLIQFDEKGYTNNVFIYPN